MQGTRLLRAGRVGRPHGLDGSFHVSEAVPNLLAAAETVVLGGDARRITRLAGHERRLILRVEGCESRDAAAALGGTELRVARESAPALGEDEWWADDLEGCTVHDGERIVGTVRRLLALPSCEVLEVERVDPAAGALLVPLVSDAVHAVDVGARRIEIDLAFLGEDD